MEQSPDGLGRHGFRPGLLTLALALLAGCATTLHPRTPWGGQGGDSFPTADLEDVLARFVDDAGRVDYPALVAEPDALDRFYGQVAAVSPESHPQLFPAREDQLAYWINAYNAAVLSLVKEVYPIASVRDVRRPWAAFFLPRTSGFFYFREVVVGGREISLYALENEVVREGFDEPRVHFALNCASRGCPRLPREVFRPETLDAQLTREAERFFAEERNLRIDPERRTVLLTEILDWFEGDFVGPEPGKAPSLLEYAARFAPQGAAKELRGSAREYRIEFVPYDWRLNDASLPSVGGGPEG